MHQAFKVGLLASPGFAKGFGPAIINGPTRMLVGEAGPEMVSVIPIKGRKNIILRSITAAAGMGQQYHLVKIMAILARPMAD